jgi:hypothetical protein
MVVVLIVPVKEASAEGFGIFDAAETLGEARLILQRLEVAFRKRVVIGGVRAVMRTGDAEIGQQEGGGLGFHRTAAVGVQRQLAGHDVVFRDRIVEQRLKQRGGLRVRDTPADDAAAEDVEDDIEIEQVVAGFSGSLNLRTSRLQLDF